MIQNNIVLNIASITQSSNTAAHTSLVSINWQFNLLFNKSFYCLVLVMYWFCCHMLFYKIPWGVRWLWRYLEWQMISKAQCNSSGNLCQMIDNKNKTMKAHDIFSYTFSIFLYIFFQLINNELWWLYIISLNRIINDNT
jgi:hypothetical protein